MKRLLAPLLASLLLAAPAAAQQVEVEVFELDNGMKWLLLPRSDQPNSIVAGWAAKVGSVNERPGITGISHFFEHMMFKGTKTIGTRDPDRDAELNNEQHSVRNRLRGLTLGQQYERWRDGEIADPWDPANDTNEMKELREQLKKLMEDHRAVTVKNEFDEIYAKMGGTQKNAFTTNDLTFYFIGLPSNKLELFCWMESDRLANPVFREFYSERDVVHEERRLRTESTPTGIFREQFEAMFWQSSPYSWPVIGWPTDLNSYTQEQAESYFQTYYRPNNLVGVVVGDFDAAQAKSQINSYFGRLVKGAAPPAVVTLEVKQLAEMRLNAECDAPPQVQVRYHTVPHGHPDEYPLEVMVEVLNGRTGRLYRSLVEEKKIAASASAGQDTRKYGGSFMFRGQVKGDGTPRQIEEAWYEQLNLLKEEPIGEKELQKVMNGFLANSFRRLQSNFFLMVQLGYFEALGGWEYINDSPKKLQAVTPDDVQRVAKKYFATENRCVATYTRKAGTKAEPEDPELAKFPPQIRNMVKQALKQLAMESNAESLRTQLQMMEGQIDQAPPPIRPAIDYMLKKAKERLAELEGAGGDGGGK